MTLRAIVLVAALLAACGDPPRGTRPLEPLDEATARQRQAHARVILVTLDGVRWQDFFDDPMGSYADGSQRPLLPGFWERLAPGGIVLGDRGAGSWVHAIGRRPASLPQYQGLLAGYTQPCEDNHCGRIGVPTVLESVRERLDLRRGEVAVFSSWKYMLHAIFDPNSIHVDAGPKEDTVRPPWGASRWDDETFELAIDYLRDERPRLLYLALNDSDEWGHKEDREAYLSSIRSYDSYLVTLAGLLERMGPEVRDSTTILLTTDHGRCPWLAWRNHDRCDDSHEVFLAGFPTVPAVGRARRAQRFTHADVRPTIERLFGLPPSPCDDPSCGAPIVEIAGPATDGRTD